MSRHSFEPRVAKQVGLNAAVLFQNITFWIEKNQANKRNFREGRYWTYNSVSAFKKLFPYLTEKQVRTALEKLVKSGLILKGKYGSDRYDQTTWYALGKTICPNGQADLTKKENDTFDPEVKDTAFTGKSYSSRYKPIDNPYPSKEVDEAKKILGTYPIDRIRHKADCLLSIGKILSDGIAADDLLRAVQAYASESSGFTRQRVCFSDNWFSSERWKRYLLSAHHESKIAKAEDSESLKKLAGWIIERNPVCKHITPKQISSVLVESLVTPIQIQEAGLNYGEEGE